MARSAFSGYRPVTGRSVMDMLAQRGGPQQPSRGSSQQIIPQTPMSALASFDGKVLGWTGGPALKAGQMINGSRVMSGTGGALNSVVGAGPQNNSAWGGKPLGSAPAPGTPAMGPTAAPGGAGSKSLLPAEVQAMMDKANAANEKRYGQLLDNNADGKKEIKGALDSGWGSIIGAQKSQADALRSQMQSGWGDVLGLVGQNSTAPALERERRRAQAEIGGNQQSMVSRGLNNTTILDSTRRGIVDDSALRTEEIHNAQRDREATVRQNMLAQTIPAEFRLNEAAQGMMQNQLGQTVPALERANAERQGIIERRSDDGPNMALYAQLLAQQGASELASQQAAQQAANATATNSSTAAYQQLLNSFLNQMPQQQIGNGRPAQQPNQTGWSRPSDQPQYPQNPYGGVFGPNAQQPQRPQEPAKPTFTYQDKQAAAQYLKMNGKPVSAEAVARLLESGWTPQDLQDAIPVNDLSQYWQE